jgi:hypothetical protein
LAGAVLLVFARLRVGKQYSRRLLSAPSIVLAADRRRVQNRAWLKTS